MENISIWWRHHAVLHSTVLSPPLRHLGFYCHTLTLTHWGRVTHICLGNLTIIGPDNGLSPGRWQAIIWTNAGIMLIGTSGTNFSEMLIKIQTFSLKKIHLKMLSVKCCSFRLDLNVLRQILDRLSFIVTEPGHDNFIALLAWLAEDNLSHQCSLFLIPVVLWHYA